jgi:hypothetical protein
MAVSEQTATKALFQLYGHTEQCRMAFNEYLDTLPDLLPEDRRPGDTTNPCKGLCRAREGQEIAEVLAKLEDRTGD